MGCVCRREKGDQRRNLKLFDGDTMDNVVRCPYLIVEYIVVSHKYKFTKKYNGCQITCKRN